MARVLMPAVTALAGTAYESHCTACSGLRRAVAELFHSRGAGAFSTATGVPFRVALKPSAQRMYRVRVSSDAGAASRVKVHSASRRELMSFIAVATSVS